MLELPEPPEGHSWKMRRISLYNVYQLLLMRKSRWWFDVEIDGLNITPGSALGFDSNVGVAARKLIQRHNERIEYHRAGARAIREINK